MGKKQIYKQVLPVDHDKKILNQFGETGSVIFKPFSIIKPTKHEKEKWKEAYLNDDIIDERKGYGIRNSDGIAKMSEFHAGLAENVIRYWSMKGSRVIDPFAGRVTRAVVTNKLDREYYGYEISPKTHQRSISHFNNLKINPTLFLGDGLLMDQTADDFGDLIFTCPPYFNIEKYESVENQLSDIKSYTEFIDKIDICSKNCFRVLKNGAFCIWVVADFRKNCELIPFHSDVICSFMKVGFINYDLIVIENITPFSAMQLEKVADKRYASKIHEFMLVFKKPGEYIIPNYCKPDIEPKYQNHFA